jgi:hypothetical protein
MLEASTEEQEEKEALQSGRGGTTPSGCRSVASGAEEGGVDEPVPAIGSGTGARPECGTSTAPLRSGVVQEFIARMVQQGQFSVGYLRRTQNKEFVKKALARGGISVASKPNGLHIAEMFDAEFMVPGANELPPGTHGLKLDGMRAGHVPTCKLCTSASSSSGMLTVHVLCYFYIMLECIRCGWKPPIPGKVEEQYDCRTGNKDSIKYAAAFDEQVNKLLSATEHAGPVLQPYNGAPEDLTLNRAGLNVKSTDITRGRARVGVDASKGAEELAEANRLLVVKNEDPIKVRLTTDATASGVNAAAMVPPFSYPTVHDAVVIIRRNDWLGKGDVERYYMLFPLASESRHWFGMIFHGALYWFAMLFFGFAAGSYYASVWSAELRRWVMHLGVRCVHMMDDWMVSEATEEEARGAMGIIAAAFLLAGIRMAERKYYYGQRMLFLGIMLDTIRMSMSFDKDQCRDFARVLREAVESVGAQGQQLPMKEVSSIAGKLNWYGSILQVGRLHDSAWWEYLSLVRKGGKRYVSASLLKRIIEDSEWWIAQLETWADGELAGNEFPILSASELLAREDAVEVIQSDASGPDGCGYMFGALDSSDPEYVSRRWKDAAEAEEHSTYQELVALLERVQEKSASATLVIWVSDSGSAVYSVNKGRAKEPRTLEIVSAILTECDLKGFQIVGLWVPRELNLMADHLSHLATCLNRDSVSGRISELDPEAGQD